MNPVHPCIGEESGSNAISKYDNFMGLFFCFLDDRIKHDFIAIESIGTGIPVVVKVEEKSIICGIKQGLVGILYDEY